MKLIDFHTHIYPDGIASKATKSVEDFYSAKAENTGTADILLREARRAGVSLNVILPVAVKPAILCHINDFALSMQQEHKEFYAFGTIHAEAERPEAELERIMKAGLHGIKIHPDTQLFNIDDERLFPVYSLMEGKIPLIAHTGDPRYSFSHPSRLRRVMKEFPRLVCIGAHFGGWSMSEEGAACLADMENCYVDISSSFDFGVTREMAESLISRFGGDRVLFASDFPLGSPVKEKENLMRLRLSDDTREKIAYKNAERLLGIKL